MTRYGGGPRGPRRARAAALLMLALPGGAYVYQGEELGCRRSPTCPTSCARTRPSSARAAAHGPRRLPGADPLVGDTPPFGFGPDGAWLPQPADWAALTVQRRGRRPVVDAVAVPRALRSAGSTPLWATGR